MQIRAFAHVQESVHSSAQEEQKEKVIKLQEHHTKIDSWFSNKVLDQNRLTSQSLVEPYF